MKKGKEYTGIVERVDFPDKGIVYCAGEEETQSAEPVQGEECVSDEAYQKSRLAVVKDCIPGQRVTFRVTKKRSGRAEGQLLRVEERSPLETKIPECPHFGECGSCKYQTLPYTEQLKMKEAQVQRILNQVIDTKYDWQGILRSPIEYEYRNKMEFSFGNAVKDGPLTLGLHKRGSFYDVINVPECRLVDGDIRTILAATLQVCQKHSLTFFHKISHQGYLRHLLVRKAAFTGEILVALVTTSQCPADEAEFLQEFTEALTKAKLQGRLMSVLHTRNDSLSDVIQNDGTTILYGTDHIQEELLGLRFKISAFSFFQTNSRGAEVLYSKAREFVGETKDKVIFDLYSGTGTIAQLLAPVAKKVIGVEIIEEAVEAAKVNAVANGLNNCNFLAGDVLAMLDQIPEKPDFIVLDPPRDGINPKALAKIIAYNVDSLLYISCKPTSLARDLVMLQEAGYEVRKAACVDLFVSTPHVEVVTWIQRCGKSEK